jgi:hypothetical protein
MHQSLILRWPRGQRFRTLSYSAVAFGVGYIVSLDLDFIDRRMMKGRKWQSDSSNIPVLRSSS